MQGVTGSSPVSSTPFKLNRPLQLRTELKLDDRRLARLWLLGFKGLADALVEIGFDLIH